MLELLPLDQTIRLSPQMMVDEEERQYLSELLRQDILEAELGLCYLETMADAHVNLARSSEDFRGDFFPSAGFVGNNLQDDLMPNRDDLLYKEGVEYLYKNNLPVQANPDSNRIS